MSEKVQIHVFKEQDVVYAKKSGGNFWPAKIITCRSKDYVVEFFGKNSPHVLAKKNHVLPFPCDEIIKFLNERCMKSSDFIKAVELAESSLQKVPPPRNKIITRLAVAKSSSLPSVLKPKKQIKPIPKHVQVKAPTASASATSNNPLQVQYHLLQQIKIVRQDLSVDKVKYERAENSLEVIRGLVPNIKKCVLLKYPLIIKTLNWVTKLIINPICYLNKPKKKQKELKEYIVGIRNQAKGIVDLLVEAGLVKLPLDDDSDSGFLKMSQNFLAKAPSDIDLLFEYLPDV